MAAHTVRPVRGPRFDGYHLSLRIASQPLGRCGACHALIYLRYDDDNAMLGIEHQPGNIDCPNWDTIGELRLVKVTS